MTKITKDIFANIGVIAAIPFVLALHGWAVSTLWGWFVVPLGVPGLSIASALGLVLVCSTLRPSRSSDNEDRKPGERLTYAVMHPLAGVALGWIVKLFV